MEFTLIATIFVMFLLFLVGGSLGGHLGSFLVFRVSKKVSKLLFNIWWFIRFKIQSYITQIALYSLAFISLVKWDNQFFTVGLIVIGICVATSQTVFSYLPSLRKEEDKNIIETLKKAGEHFLGAALWLSISLLVLYVDLQLEKLFETYSWFDFLDVALKVVVLFNFTTSADSINKGLHRVGYIIWWKVDI